MGVEARESILKLEIETHISIEARRSKCEITKYVQLGSRNRTVTFETPWNRLNARNRECRHDSVRQYAWCSTRAALSCRKTGEGEGTYPDHLCVSPALGQHLLSPVPDLRRSWFAQVPVFTNRRHYYSSGHCKCSAVLSSPNAALALANKNRIKRLDEAKGRLMAFYKKQGQKANKIAREHIRDKMESISSGYQSRLSVLERVLVHRITDM